MKTIGVDLGTTNSCVYYLDDDGNPVLVSDKLNRKIFPSAVYRGGPDRPVIVGHLAKSRVGQTPPPLLAVKRKMGTTEQPSLGGQPITPVEVSAHILQHAKSLVEEITGDRVGAAVITVPAYFDAAPRKDTHEAAVRAFFGGDPEAAKGRLELQLEPDAAAFAYTLEDATEKLRLLVYDLGGGTFDVTLLDKSPGAGLTELKFGGDPHLGGENFDDRVATWFLYLLRGGRADALERLLIGDRYPREQRYSLLLQLLTDDRDRLPRALRPEDRELMIGTRPGFRLDLDSRRPEDFVRIQKLKRFAERAKHDLTTRSDTSICEQGAFEDHDGQLVDLDLNLDRGQFNLLVGDLIDRTLEETRRVLEESRVGVDEIDRVLLVGGSTRMPIVAEELEKIFSCQIVSKDPDLIVARGAALRARDLGVVIEGAAGERQLELEYPHETPYPAINVKGRLPRPLTEHRVCLSREGGGEVASTPLGGDRFLLSNVPLLPDALNTFLLEIVDPDDKIYVAAQIRIRHDPKAVASAGTLTTKITKPICSQDVHGNTIKLVPEGTDLPFNKPFTCHRSTTDSFIRIPFFEGNRQINDLVIDLAPDLPLGVELEVVLTIEKNCSARATATVLLNRQSKDLDFQIERITVLELEAIDADFHDVEEQIRNDLASVNDPNARAPLSRQAKRLAIEYQKARRELQPDSHKLLATVGELRKLLMAVRAAHNFLEPPFEVFEGLLETCRGLAGQAPAAVEKIDLDARTGEEAWEKKDAATWRKVCGYLEKLRGELERAARGPAPSIDTISPEVIRRDLLRWLSNLEDRAADAQLGNRFSDRLQATATAVRSVDLRHEDAARNELIRIVQRQVAPLEKEIDRAIAELTGKEAPPSTSTVEWHV